MFVITLQSWLFWLLLVRSLDRAYGDEMTKGESGSPSNVSTRFDTGVVFFKSTFHQGRTVDIEIVIIINRLYFLVNRI
jgi:hypothetical protein